MDLTPMLDHFYQRIPGFFSFRSVYDDALRCIADQGTWVEVGSWQGRSIAYAVVESLRLGKQLDFHVVDIWTLAAKHIKSDLATDEDLYQSFCKHTAPIKEHITVHQQSSHIAANQFEDSSLDFVMIDADHAYESVLRDIEAWWPKIKPQGRLVGDDLRPSFPGVRQAVTEFVTLHQLPWSKKSGCWIIDKP